MRYVDAATDRMTARRAPHAAAARIAMIVIANHAAANDRAKDAAEDSTAPAARRDRSSTRIGRRRRNCRLDEPAAVRQPLGVSDGVGADANTCISGISVLTSATWVGIADAFTVGCSVRMTLGPFGAFFGLTANS